MEISQAKSPIELETARALFGEYAAETGLDLCFQGFPTELANLPGLYAPPRGRLLIAWSGSNPTGCVALRPLGDDVCELKRMYVRPAFRGRGVGRRLTEAILAEARSFGYATMKLDTLPVMLPAVRLYESLGFVRCTAYYNTPLTETIFMECRLKAS
jgi:putative acetyltransferase